MASNQRNELNFDISDLEMSPAASAPEEASPPPASPPSPGSPPQAKRRGSRASATALEAAFAAFRAPKGAPPEGRQKSEGPASAATDAAPSQGAEPEAPSSEPAAKGQGEASSDANPANEAAPSPEETAAGASETSGPEASGAPSEAPPAPPEGEAQATDQAKVPGAASEDELDAPKEDGAEEAEPETVEMPSADDLLKQAGMILSGGAKKEAEAPAEESDDNPPPANAEEETAEAEAGKAEVAPEPQAPAGAASAEPKRAEEKEFESAGPAPAQAKKQDAFAVDTSLEGFNLDDDDDDDSFGFPDLFAAPAGKGGALSFNDEPALSADADEATRGAKAKRPSLLAILWACAALLGGAAALAAVLLLEAGQASAKRHSDRDAAIGQTKLLVKETLGLVADDGLYKISFLDTKAKKKSLNEIELRMRVKVQLNRNLYAPLAPREEQAMLAVDADALVSARALAEEAFPEEAPPLPQKPWKRLLRPSATRGETLALRASGTLVRDSEESRWELGGIRLEGEGENLVWPEGKPREAYGPRAYAIDSDAFLGLLAEYNDEASNYLDTVKLLESREKTAYAQSRRAQERSRQALQNALSKGSLYRGMAIVGEDASAAMEVDLLITDVLAEGGLVKGAFKSRGSRAFERHFTAKIDYVEGEDEETLTGRLRLVAARFPTDGDFAGAPDLFNPNAPVRIELRADGKVLEGDTRDLSLRLLRASSVSPERDTHQISEAEPEAEAQTAL